MNTYDNIIFGAMIVFDGESEICTNKSPSWMLVLYLNREGADSETTDSDSLKRIQVNRFVSIYRP